MLVNGENLSTNVEKLNVKRTFSSKEENKRTLNVKNSDKALYLVEKFKKLGYNDADNCYHYFIKCFNNLSENTVWEIFEKTVSNTKANSKIKYFIGYCRNKMEQPHF
jgi:hypothetical protein